MFLAHIFLPAMLLVICRSQQTPSHPTNPYGTEENMYGSLSHGSSETTSTANDDLLDRYRQLTTESLLKLYDSCKVHDFLQNIKHNMENDIDDDDPLKSGGAAKDNHQRYINTLLRLLEKQQNLDNDVSMIFPNERFDESPKSALYYYVTISMFLQDKELDDSLSFMLYEKCCKSDVNFYGSTICTRNDDSMARKRNTVKKVKFHSWGGKRSGEWIDKRSGSNGQTNVRMPANVDLGKDVGQSKIVIRTPFRPWGGRK